MLHTYKNAAKALTLLLICSTVQAAPTSALLSTTFSILGYAKWATPTPIICVIDNTDLSTQFKAYPIEKDSFQVKALKSSQLKANSCQIIFFSTLTPEEEQKILNTSVQYPALSLSSNNVDCEIGSAFCLYKKQQRMSFKINMDSLTQSRVHVDPRVLLLARASEQ